MVDTTSIRIIGDRFMGQRYIGHAYNELGKLRQRMRTNNLSIGNSQIVFSSGLIIQCQSIHGQHTAYILVDQFGKEEIEKVIPDKDRASATFLIKSNLDKGGWTWLYVDPVGIDELEGFLLSQERRVVRSGRVLLWEWDPVEEPHAWLSHWKCFGDDYGHLPDWYTTITAYNLVPERYSVTNGAFPESISVAATETSELRILKTPNKIIFRTALYDDSFTLVTGIDYRISNNSKVVWMNHGAYSLPRTERITLLELKFYLISVDDVLSYAQQTSSEYVNIPYADIEHCEVDALHDDAARLTPDTSCILSVGNDSARVQLTTYATATTIVDIAPQNLNVTVDLDLEHDTDGTLTDISVATDGIDSGVAVIKVASGLGDYLYGGLADILPEGVLAPDSPTWMKWIYPYDLGVFTGRIDEFELCPVPDG